MQSVKNDRALTGRALHRLNSSWQLHLMLLLPVCAVLLFSYGPMYGIVIAFQKFRPARGMFGAQEWVGFANFRFMFSLKETWNVLQNTLFIAILKIIFGTLTPILFALLLNEVRGQKAKRVFQTAVYLPHFLSWVLLAGVLREFLSINGIFNKLLGMVGIKSVYFLGDPNIFPWTMVFTDVWKGFGYGTIVYLAALSNIDPTLYEAAEMDGAKRFRQTWHVTLPGMAPIVILMSTLSLGSVLNAGFDQIFNLYSTQVMSTGDIIDTYVYRLGMQQAQYSYATVVGFTKSLVSSLLIGSSYYFAYRFGDYRIF